MYENCVRIKCNPYTKRIDYSYLNESDEWIPVSSKLSSDEFTQATIQHKVHEIIQEINKVYNLGNKGLQLVFEGTKDDYVDVCTEINEYFSDYNIDCVRGYFELDCADVVMPVITSIFDSINDTFQKYPDNEITDELAKFSETVKPTVAICVMGLYSSGKSAFINSLIGDEILPSASDPTTAKNYKITNCTKAKIYFQYDDICIKLSFNGIEYSSNQTGELEIVRELQEAIDSSPVHNQATHMYNALQVINRFDDERNDGKHISTLIEVYTPFVDSKLPLGKFTFAIFDTPGSDSNHKDHLDVLKDSLQGQTNGLPIFVTTPDEMDKEKNNEIIDIIEKMGEALDQTSTIVIVNKSDEKDSDVLEAKKKKGSELRITKWHSSRVFFVSSIMGLGSKKKNPLDKTSWIDKQYFKVFKQQHESFSNPEDDFYMQLYRYDFLPLNRVDQVLASAQNITQGSQVILLNSGVGSGEEEISIFAHKYALYNKCIQARQYLQNAIDLVAIKLDTAKSESKDIEREMITEIDEKTKALIDKLVQESSNMSALINKEYSDGIQAQIESMFSKSAEKKKIDDAWDQVKEAEKKAEVRNELIDKKVNDLYSSINSRICNSVNRWTEDFWSNAEQKYKKHCCEIVMESTALSQEQKKFLNEIVMNATSIGIKNVKLDLRKANIIRDKRFFWLFKIGEEFHLESCKDHYINLIMTVTTKMNSVAVSENEKNFNQWRERLEMELKSNISSFNPALLQLADDLEKCRQEIGRLNKQRNVLSEQKELLEGLLDFKEVENERCSRS